MILICLPCTPSCLANMLNRSSEGASSSVKNFDSIWNVVILLKTPGKVPNELPEEKDEESSGGREVGRWQQQLSREGAEPSCWANETQSNLDGTFVLDI